MTTQDRPYTFDRVVRLVLSAAGVIGTILLLRYLSDVLIPFAAAVVLAYLLNPLVTLFERKTGRRGLAVALTLSGMGILGLALIALLIPLIILQVDRFRYDLTQLRRDVTASVNANAESEVDSNPQGPSTDSESEETQSDSVADSGKDDAAPKSSLGWSELKDGWAQYRARAEDVPRAERLRDLRRAVAGTYAGDLIEKAVSFTRSDEFNALLIEFARRAAISGWTVVTWVVNLLLGLTVLIIVLLYLIFLLLDYRDYARNWKRFLPPSYRESIVEFIEEFDLAMRRYFRGQSVVALLTGALFAIGFTIIGLPMALPFGLFVGLLNMVPYLQSVALIPAMMLAALRALEGDGGFLTSVALVLAVFGVIQIVLDGIITPRIMGKAVGLRPVAIMLGLFIWGKLLGFLGVLLAIPLTCLGIAYYQRFILKREPETLSTE